MNSIHFHESGDTSIEVLSGETGFIPVQGGAEVDTKKKLQKYNITRKLKIQKLARKRSAKKVNNGGKNIQNKQTFFTLQQYIFTFLFNKMKRSRKSP